MNNRNKLDGLRVLNTRPLEQGLLLSKAICDAGGISIDLPAMVIEPTANDWLKFLPNVATIHHAIFISTHAIHYFFETIKQQGLAWPTTINTIAIGNASAAKLEKWKIRVDAIPSIADSDHLLQLDALQQVKNQTIILIKGEDGRADIANTLSTRGANLMPLDVYRRILPSVPTQQIHSLWHDNVVDIILFTSQQAMHNVFTLFGTEARAWLHRTPCLVISERLAKVAVMYGMKTIIVSRYDEILNTLEHYNEERARNNVTPTKD